MPNFARGAVLNLSLDPDDTIIFTGTARAKIASLGGNTAEQALTGTQVLGPYGVNTTLVITCDTAGSYTQSFQPHVDTIARWDSARAGLVNPDTGVTVPLSGGSGAVTPVPFSAVVALDAQKIMDATYGAPSFTLAASPVSGAQNRVTVVSDGVNIPSFTGFTQAGGSGGFDSSAVGIFNYIEFWYDGYKAWYAVTQANPNTPDLTFPAILPVLKYAATAPDGSKIFLTYNVPLNTTPPANGSFVPNGRTVTNVAISGPTVTLTLSAPYISSDTPTLTYTVPGSNPLSGSGNNQPAAALAAAAVVNLVGTSVPLQLPTITGTLTELLNTPATGQFTYQGTTNAFSANTGVSTKSLPASTDGFIVFEVESLTTGANYPIVGFKTAATNGGYLTLVAAIGQSNLNKYAYSTGGSQTSSPYTAAIGDRMRVRRTGQNIIAEFARVDNPSVWIPIATLSTTSTAQLYVGADCPSTVRRLVNLQASPSLA